MKYYLVVGEASGDLHASNLMRAIISLDATADFRFIGGDKMRNVGGCLVAHYKDLAYMGVWPVLTHLFTILSSRRRCVEDIKSWNPDLLILVDYPGFNLSVARSLKGVISAPIVYYIAPKLWAWKSYRIKHIKRYIDRMFTILPFETNYFNSRGYSVDYVGNPSVDAVVAHLREVSISNCREPYVADGKRVVAILAGSRRQEISRNLPTMLKAIEGLEGVHPVIAAAPGIEREFYTRFLDGLSVEICYNQTYSLLSRSYVALVTSGTATLETALFNVPQVVCYKMPLGKIVSTLRPLFIKVKYVSLVNLITGKQSVPELIADDMTIYNIRKSLIPLLMETKEREMQLRDYKEMSRLLGEEGASMRAAQKMVNMVS